MMAGFRQRKKEKTMAKIKTNPKTESVETKEAIAEVVNSAEGISGKVKTEKKSVTSYEVVDLPKNREKLGPQLRALVEAVDETKEEIGGKQVVFRARLFAKWTDKVGSESGDKVFASYMHQLLSFAFLERIGVAATPKKVISPMERKQKLLDMLAKLPEADRKELLASMAG